MKPEEANNAKEVINLRADLELKKHGYKMEQLKTELLNAKIIHDLELQKIRIKSAEIRRSKGLR